MTDVGSTYFVLRHLLHRYYAEHLGGVAGVVIMGANTKEFTDAGFAQDVLKSSQPVLVDFWAPWCGPCRQIAPMIDQLAAENAGSVVVGKVNIDENPATAQAYGIESIPTLLVFKGGQVVQRIVGGKPKSMLQSVLDAAKG